MISKSDDHAQGF